MNKDEVEEIVDNMFTTPEEAMGAFPDECANCGVGAAPFFVPDDYHEQPHHKRDPGICTECGHHFGSGNPRV